MSGWYLRSQPNPSSRVPRVVGPPKPDRQRFQHLSPSVVWQVGHLKWFARGRLENSHSVGTRCSDFTSFSCGYVLCLIRS
jgi:hypothetical protein